MADDDEARLRAEPCKPHEDVNATSDAAFVRLGIGRPQDHGAVLRAVFLSVTVMLCLLVLILAGIANQKHQVGRTSEGPLKENIRMRTAAWSIFAAVVGLCTGVIGVYALRYRHRPLTFVTLGGLFLVCVPAVVAFAYAIQDINDYELYVCDKRADVESCSAHDSWRALAAFTFLAFLSSGITFATLVAFVRRIPALKPTPTSVFA